MILRAQLGDRKTGQLDTGAKAALDDAQEVARVAEARVSDEAVTADMPLAVPRAASAPSSAHMRCSNMSTVGFE